MSTQHTASSIRHTVLSHRFVCCLLSAVCCLLATGCIHRSLTIRSEPPGATILMNDKRLGTTPYVYDFEWYGWYRLTLTKPGYERLDDHVELRAPGYLWIPMDLAMELLPMPVHDAKTLSYTLTVKPKLPEPQPPVLDIPNMQTEETAHDAAR